MRGLSRVAALLSLCLLGCGQGDVPTAKYFGGEPVDHWLEATRSTDQKTRKKAVDVLGNVGASDPRTVPALIGAVKDADARVRDAAVLALSKIGPPASEALAVLQQATRDRDATVRAHAVLAVEQVRGTK